VVEVKRGKKFFEWSNHLVNVLATVSDRKIAHSDNSSMIDYYIADVISAQDYYPFGMIMPGRTIVNGSGYRYGFNGKENDKEVKGEGKQQDYGMRIYDPRLGRFLSVDPISNEYPELTPYQFASNTPIWAIDLDGLEGLVATGMPMGNSGNGHGMILSVPDARRINSTISNWVSTRHQQGLRNYRTAEQYRQTAIRQGRVNGDGITWLTKAMVYISPWWNSTATLSDANDGAVLMQGKNLDGKDATVGDYVASGMGIFVPVLSGASLKKIGNALIEGTIGVFRNGQEIRESAYKIGSIGHKGTKEYNSVLNAIKNGGNIVANSKEEALKLLKEAMPGIKDETGKQASKFGYRIDSVSEEAKEGLKQGHQGTHINYYNKQNKVWGTIVIENKTP
jgi:RHS repeat-associated protein